MDRPQKTTQHECVNADVTKKSGHDAIYAEINRELRTQYLLAFTSNSDRPKDELRKIKVQVDRKKVKVRTITGYFPVGG